MLRDPAISLMVLPEVYAPAEDTFLMLSALEVRKGEKVLEMGCGSGFLALHLAKAGARVTAVDIDPFALSNTEENARSNGLRLEVLHSDMFQQISGRFDLMVFNPPYLRGIADGPEDLCWAGGENGLALTNRFLAEAKEHLEKGGRLLVLYSTDVKEDDRERSLQGWKVEVLASKRLFFEELSVLELSL